MTVRQLGACLDLRRIAALWRWRLSTSPLDPPTADLGAPFHWLPRGARGAIVARRRASLKVLYSRAYNKLLRPQLLQQRLRLLQIARVEPFREPPVNRSQQFARLLHLALVAPEASEAHGGAEFPGFGLLLTGD
jgi:hypothetical protein